jgi:glycosyltransferase A (GT-A) superfamily protein (DUF2064 family)
MRRSRFPAAASRDDAAVCAGADSLRTAAAAQVSVTTVRNFETEKSARSDSTLDVMRRALKAAGVEFTKGDRPGVRLKG